MNIYALFFKEWSWISTSPIHKTQLKVNPQLWSHFDNVHWCTKVFKCYNLKTIWQVADRHKQWPQEEKNHKIPDGKTL
jgi:hypothetical protein